MFIMIFLFIMCFPSNLKIHLGKDYVYFFDSLLAQMVKSLPSMPEAWVPSLGPEDLLEKEMATHSRILA